MTYEIILRNYRRGLWTIGAVQLAVKKGIITKEQYKEITEQDYE